MSYTLEKLFFNSYAQQALLYIAAEDEAFLAFNREMDAMSFVKENQSDSEEELETVQDQSYPDSEEHLLQLDGKSISEWLSELDAISKEVEAELVSRDIGCHSVQILEAVNTVLFDTRGFERTSKRLALDPKYSYLHSVLNSRCGTGNQNELSPFRAFLTLDPNLQWGYCYLIFPCCSILV